MINNACATQAILSVLLNCKHSDILLGSNLEEFKNFCQSFDASTRGLALSNSDVIREVHNSFSRYFSYTNHVHIILNTNYFHYTKYEHNFFTGKHYLNMTQKRHLKMTMYFIL